MELVRGLTRSKTYDWKDSNVALIGSADDKKVKKESAATEKAWKHAGEKPGLKIWRIENFKVVDWPEKQYGTFYSGDSYIILNTHKEAGGNELLYDLHFWIGSQSTQDEYGSAAYKTVELDTFLDDKPVQHREVEGHESNLFKSYFKNGITLLAGGAESGFHHVTTQEYKPRLLHFHGSRQHVVLNEVPNNPARLNPDDVFILDSGSKIIQWNGSKSNKDERFKASQYANQLRSQRGSCSVEVLEESDASEQSDFVKKLDQPDQPDHIKPDVPGEKVLLRVSDAGGHVKQEEVKRGAISLSDFSSKDVFIFDSGDQCFVWIGENASPEEKQNGIGYAHNYLMGTQHALIPVHVIKEGQNSKDFNLAIAA